MVCQLLLYLGRHAVDLYARHVLVLRMMQMFLKYPEDLVDQLFKLMVVVSSLSSIPCTSRALVGQFLLLGHRAVDLFVHHVFGLPRGPCRPLPAHLCYPMDLAGAKILAIFRRLHLDRVVSNASRNGQKGHAVLNFSGRGRPGRDPGLQKSRLESKTLTPQFVFFPTLFRAAASGGWR